MTQICTVIPARNSALYLPRTLKSLATQTIQNSVIVVNDGSTDNTPRIAHQFGAEVIHLLGSGKNMTGTPYLANVINAGLKRTELYDPEFILIAGSDDIFPRNYIEKLLEHITHNGKVVLCSGYVQSERYPTSPRGAGRLIQTPFFRKLGYYPHCYGWETYPVIKAQEMGLHTRVYPVPFISQRSSSRNPIKNYHLGRGMKTLGYTLPYALARSLHKLITDKQGAIYMLQGYFYEHQRSDVAEYWSRVQNQRILKDAWRLINESLALIPIKLRRLIS